MSMWKIIDKRRLYRIWFYFRRGYTQYITYIVGLANFLTIQYYLLLASIPAIKHIFPDIITFSIVAVLAIFIISTSIGYIDRKKGILKEEVSIQTEENPYIEKIIKDIEELKKNLERLLQHR